MKNLLTLVALLVSLSGIAASLLREEMRCYLGLPSQSCPTAETPFIPVSLPEKIKKQEPKPIKPVSLPQPSPSISEEPTLPPQDSSFQPIVEADSLNQTDPTDDLKIPVESAQAIDQKMEKIPEYEYAKDGIPIPIEPYDPSQ